jgi:CHAT domain
MLSAEELYRRGLARTNAGRYSSARVLLRNALARAVQPDTVARVKLSLAYVEAELGHADHGLSLCADALRTPGLSRQVRGLVESQVAGLYMRAGDGQQALLSFARAIPLLEEIPDSLARAHLNRGLVYLQRGDAERAAKDAREAGILYRRAGNDVAAAKADHNLGCARLLAGDLVSALQLLEAARPMVEGLSATYQAVVSQDRAEVLVAAGMPSDAHAALEQAARAYGSRRLRQRQAEVELILARSLAWDDPRRAASVARRAERRFHQRGSQAWALRAEAVKVAAEIECGRPSPARTARATELATQLRGLGLSHESRMMLVRAAQSELGTGDVASAGRRLRTARPTSTTPIAVRLLTREVRAEVAAAKGRRSTALDHVRRGLDELHEWQSTFGSLDLQSSLVGHGRRLAFAGLRLALADGRPEVVFEWSERARALATRVTAVRPPSDPQAVQSLTALRQAADEATAAELRIQIRQQAWYGEGSGHVTTPASLDQVAAELAESDAVLTSYLVVDEAVHCLLVGDGLREVVRLGAFGPVRSLLSGMQADLDMAASDQPLELRDVVVDGLLARVRGLGQLLVSPIAARLCAERVVVVPPAPLAGTPWSMLPRISDRTLTVPRSATLWLAARARRLATDRVGFVAGPNVPRAAEEVRAAAARWSDAQVLAGDRARAAAVSALAESVDVLHVAAHGRHSADNPLFSGLELADGPWFGYDIDQLRSIPSTVVLSACELGRSSVRWGLETIGMTVAWQHAGTRCVIAAPASVADDVACEVLATTHAGLASGAAPAEALRDAVRRQGQPLSSFLCYGAGF